MLTVRKNLLLECLFWKYGAQGAKARKIKERYHMRLWLCSVLKNESPGSTRATYKHRQERHIVPEAQRQKYAPKHSHCVTKRENHLRDFVSTPATAEVLLASSAWHEVYTQSSAGDNPQVFHRQEGAEDLTNLHQYFCAKGQTSKDKHCYYIKDIGLAKPSAEAITNFPLLGQGN